MNVVHRPGCTCYIFA